MSARADPLRNTLDHLALDPSAKDDRRYLISMLRRLGYSDKEIEVALGRGAVEIEYSKSESTGFTVVDDGPSIADSWPEQESGVAFSVTRGSVAAAGGDPAVEFGWRVVETPAEVHLPVDVDEPWQSEEEVHEGPVEFVEREDDWAEADDDVEEGDEVEWVDASELEVKEGDEVEWDAAKGEGEWVEEDDEEWEESEWTEGETAWPEEKDKVARVALKEENAGYVAPPRQTMGGAAEDEVPTDYTVNEPPGRVWDVEDDEDEVEFETAADDEGPSDDSDAWSADSDDDDAQWDADGDDDGEWAADDADTTGAFQFEDFTLYTRLVELSTGKEQRIYFFSKEAPQNGDPAALPPGYVVDVNERTGLPYLRRDAGGDGNPVRDLVEEPERLRCLAMTQSGTRCKRMAVEDSDFCSVHHEWSEDAEDEEPDHCHAIKKDGDQCRNYPREGSRYCASHKGWRGPKIGD